MSWRVAALGVCAGVWAQATTKSGSTAAAAPAIQYTAPLSLAEGRTVVTITYAPVLRFARLRAPPAPRRLVLQTLDEVQPQLCRNFAELCKGSQGRARSGEALDYRGTLLEPCAGGVTGGDVTGGRSPVGRAALAETVAPARDTAPLRVVSPTGLVYMALSDEGGCAGSRFVVQTQPDMPRRALVPFAQVVAGMEELRELADRGARARIIDCDVRPPRSSPLQCINK